MSSVTVQNEFEDGAAQPRASRGTGRGRTEQGTEEEKAAEQPVALARLPSEERWIPEKRHPGHQDTPVLQHEEQSNIVVKLSGATVKTCK